MIGEVDRSRDTVRRERRTVMGIDSIRLSPVRGLFLRIVAPGPRFPSR
jgi:hypothetical protein